MSTQRCILACALWIHVLTAALVPVARAAPQAQLDVSSARAYRAADFFNTESLPPWTSYTYHNRSLEPVAESGSLLRPNNPEPAVLVTPAGTSEVESHQKSWAAYLGQPVSHSNSAGVELVLIPPGEFVMGGVTRPRCGFGVPIQYHAKILKPFLLGRTEITQRQWRDVMCTEPWRGGDTTPIGDLYPATCISFAQAVEFCNRLSEQEGLAPYYRIEGDDIHIVGGRGYYLPSETEWEFACRAGSEGGFSFGNDPAGMEQYGWSQPVSTLISSTAGGGPSRVATKLPNALGLYDMHGNVAEWCGEFAGDDSEIPGQNPNPRSDFGVSSAVRYRRGGSWQSNPQDCRAGLNAWWQFGSSPDSTFGFRIAQRPFLPDWLGFDLRGGDPNKKD